jgi:hypothetical protein
MTKIQAQLLQDNISKVINQINSIFEHETLETRQHQWLSVIHETLNYGRYLSLNLIQEFKMPE